MFHSAAILQPVTVCRLAYIIYVWYTYSFGDLVVFSESGNGLDIFVCESVYSHLIVSFGDVIGVDDCREYGETI